MTSQVRKAVIPAAGLGTRFLPATRSVPKVLLPVVDTPLIQFAVQEAADAGINAIAFVLSPGFEAVAGHFGPQPELERMLEQRARRADLARQRAISSMASITTVIQREARGLGHAILMARDFVGDEPFAVFLPDDLIWSRRPAIAQLIDLHAQHGGSVIAAKEVPDSAVEALGIIGGRPVSERAWRVTRLVEKPRLADAPSRLAIIGRYVLTPLVFDHLEKGLAGAGGEIQITDAIAATLGREPVHACLFEGAHIDAGTPAGLLAASMYQARMDPALHDAATRMLDAAGPRAS